MNRCTLVMLGAVLISPTAWGNEVVRQSRQRRAAAEAVPVSPPTPAAGWEAYWQQDHLFNDWFGFGAPMKDLGIELVGEFAADLLGNPVGGESQVVPFEELSVVSAPYEVDGQVVGTLGVIGPTRMPYDRMIQIVDITSRLVSNALSHNK